MSLTRLLSVLPPATMAWTYSSCWAFSAPGTPLARCSEKPRMVFSGVRSSYETCLMKSDLRRSAASSPSLRSRRALSMRKRSVTSLKVTRVAPSGSGEVDSDRMERSERSTSPRSRAAGARARWPGSTGPRWRCRRSLSRDSAAMVRTCGSPSRSSRSNSQMRAKAALCSFSLPSGPNTATPSLERVQRGGLHLDQGVVVAFQGQARGDVFIQEGQAAEGMRLGDHPDGLAAGQVPGLLAGFSRVPS